MLVEICFISKPFPTPIAVKVEMSHVHSHICLLRWQHCVNFLPHLIQVDGSFSLISIFHFLLSTFAGTLISHYFLGIVSHNDHPQRSWSKVILSEVCVKNSVHGGGGMCGRVGMHGRGACVAGVVWQVVCMARGMHGRGLAWQGACVACTALWQILRDTVNEQVVCILLECILVIKMNMKKNRRVIM